MRYNRGCKPKHGDKRECEIFLILPVRLPIDEFSDVYETRWLETVIIKERFTDADYGYWTQLNWID
jgi:hypothetical protein